jgi:hypothetical protein
MELIRTKRIQLIFFIVGAIGGFLYWRLIGCNNGTCAIRSVWYWSTLWGAAVGYLIGDMLNDVIKKRKGKNRSNGKV